MSIKTPDCNCGFGLATERRTLPWRNAAEHRNELKVFTMCEACARATDEEMGRQGYGRDYYETMRRQIEKSNG